MTMQKLMEIQDKCTEIVRKAEHRQGQYESGLLMLKDFSTLLADVIRIADDCQGLAGEVRQADAKTRTDAINLLMHIRDYYTLDYETTRALDMMISRLQGEASQ